MAFPSYPLRSTRANDRSHGLTLASVQHDISTLIVRIDDVIITEGCPVIDNLIARRELYGFTLQYKFPNSVRGNRQLNQEVVVKSSSFTKDVISFKHKKVYSIELDADLINVWEFQSVQMELRLDLRRSSMLSNHPRITSELVAKTSLSLRDLIVPPFLISRDVALIGKDFSGLVGVSVELNARRAHIAERIEELRCRKPLQRSNAARHTRRRSTSRCHSCSPDRKFSPTSTAAHKTIPNREVFELSPLESSPPHSSRVNVPHVSSLPLEDRQRASSITSDFSSSDTVFLHDKQGSRFPLSTEPHSLSRLGVSSSTSRGAVELEICLHEARNLPLVRDQIGRLVPPRVFIQMLGRDEQVMSTVASPSVNPVWNWTGRFVFSCERGNLIIKVLNATEDGRFECIGMVTLNAPLRSFERSEFEITVLAPQSSGRSTITLSLMVLPVHRPKSAIELCTTRNDGNENFESTGGELLRWEGTRRNPQLVLATRRSRPTSRARTSPFMDTREEDTSHMLMDNLHQLDHVMLPIRSIL